MFLPKTYDKKLSSILDSHAENGIIPSWFVVHYLDLAADFQTHFKKMKIAPKKILDIGGRSLPYAYKQKSMQLDYYDPRENNHNAINALGINANVIHLKDIMPSEYDLILINKEVLGLSKTDQKVSVLNEEFRKDLAVFSYTLKQRDDSFGLSRYLDDGSFYDSLEAQRNFKTLSSHMHMGFKSYEYKHVTFTDLTKDY